MCPAEFRRIRRSVRRALLCLLVVAVPSRASDYAAQVVEYVQGGTVPKDAWTAIPFNNPQAALGPPTLITTDDPPYPLQPSEWWPVNPVFQPFRVYFDAQDEPVFELVSIGQGGRLVLKFDHPVMDDPKNPCGIDFIVFGNANLRLNGQWWDNDMDPSTALIDASQPLRAEQAIVSVSQTGEPGSWRTFNDPHSPFALKADSWAPTLGRVLREPVAPDTNWWGEPTDPTLPFNPNLGPAAFGGLSVADACRKYGHSAGGTGFDLALVGLAWFQYIRFEPIAKPDLTPEIDAVSDVRAFVFPDFDCDTDVDADDLDVLRGCATGPHVGPVAPGCERADLDEDGDVDQSDFALYQRCISGPGVMAEFGCMNG